MPSNSAKSIETGNAPTRTVRPWYGIIVRVGATSTSRRADLQEVLGRDGALEAHEVGSEHALDDLLAPRQLHEQLLRRQRDVQEEADAEIGPQRAQQRRHEVQLVVVHPHGRALGGDLRGQLGEALVGLDVALPPLAPELGRPHGVVVERPQRAVGEALVEALDLARVEADRRQAHAAVVEGLGRRSDGAGPADPRPAPGLHDRRQGAHEAAGADFPGAVVGAHDGQPVGDDDDLVGLGAPCAHIATVAPPVPDADPRGLFVRGTVR